jgi:hypothetical protein
MGTSFKEEINLDCIFSYERSKIMEIVILLFACLAIAGFFAYLIAKDPTQGGKALHLR